MPSNQYNYLTLTLIFCGGGIGAVLRFLVGKIILNITNFTSSLMPLGILFVNLSGCFAIGFLATFFVDEFAISNNWRMFIIVGILGGYTTFSSFSLDVINLLQNQQILFAILYATITLFGCLVATWFGVVCGKL